MWLYFNKNGQLLEALDYGAQARVGSTGFEIFAYFEGVDVTTDYTVGRMYLIKPESGASIERPVVTYPLTPAVEKTFNSSEAPGAQYFENGKKYYGFSYSFDGFTDEEEEVISILDTSGLWQAVISLEKTSGSIKVQGSATFAVGGTSFIDETDVPIHNIIERIYDYMSTLLPKKSDFYLRVVNNISEIEEFESFKYNLGDIIFDKHTSSFYFLDGTSLSSAVPTKLDLVFNNIEALKLKAIEVETTDLKVTGNITDGNITVKLEDLATKSYVDTHAGKIDSISINGVNQPVVNKNVDLPAYPTRTSLNIDNVDNTSDLNKPISIATNNVLQLKANDSEVVHKTGDETVNGIKTIPSIEITQNGSIGIDDDIGALRAEYDSQEDIQKIFVGDSTGVDKLYLVANGKNASIEDGKFYFDGNEISSFVDLNDYVDSETKISDFENIFDTDKPYQVMSNSSLVTSGVLIFKVVRRTRPIPSTRYTLFYFDAKGYYSYNGEDDLLSNILVDGNYHEYALSENIPTVVSDLENDAGYITEADISGKEDKINKVTSIGSSSTDTEYPSAKAVYDALEAKASKSDLSAEELARQNADSSISARVATVEDDYLTSGDKAQLEGLIDDEEAARIASSTSLQNQIDNLKARGRYLSIWNATTGLPADNPDTLPYTYHSGDYYVIGNVGSVNYKPTGTTYDGTASTSVEDREISSDDFYYFDGTSWALQINTQKTVRFANIAGDPYDNTNLTAALDEKANATVLSAHTTNTNNPHSVTKAQVGLGNVDNTSDLDKPISTATQNALNGKQEALVSGTNIKTVNGTSVLGSGNIDTNNLFWCTYGTTSYNDISSALEAGKIPVCRYLGFLFIFSCAGPNYYFSSINEGKISFYIYVNTLNIWHTNTYSLEIQGNKTNIISSSSTDTQYPSAKAVWDLVAPKAEDDDVVHLTGDEDISGIKTFSEISIESAYSTPLSIDFNGDENYAIHIDDNSTNTSIGIITEDGNGGSYLLTLPAKDGTLATLNDIPTSSIAINDYEELPEIDDSNKNAFARLDGGKIYSPEFSSSQEEQVDIYAECPNSNQISDASTAQGYIDSDNEVLTITGVDTLYGNKYTIGSEVYAPFRAGTKKTSGGISFTIDRELVDGERLFLSLTSYFSYNSSQQTFSSEQGYAIIDGVRHTLNFTDSTTRPSETLIELENYTTGDLITISGVSDEEGISKRFFFNGVRILTSGEDIKVWHELARKSYVDSLVEPIQEDVSSLQGDVSEHSQTIAQQEEDILDLQIGLQETSDRIGDVQIWNANSFPTASERFVNKILRVDGVIKQCVREGDGFDKNYSFENVQGTGEVIVDNYADFERQVTDGFGNFFTICASEETNQISTNGYYIVDAKNPSLNGKTIVASNNASVFDVKAVFADESYIEYGESGETEEARNYQDCGELFVEYNNSNSYITNYSTNSYDLFAVNSYEDNDCIEKIYFTSVGKDTFDDDVTLTHYIWDNVKLFRNSGSIRLGNSSNTGKVVLTRKDDSELDITGLKLHVDTWNDHNKSGLKVTVGEDVLEYPISYETYGTGVDINISDLSIAPNSSIILESYVTEDEGTVFDEEIGEEVADTIYGDRRIIISSIRVDYGSYEYVWKELGGGANVEVVTSLPEQGEENTIYLIKNEPVPPEPVIAELMQSVTYNELKELRDTKQLVPGMQYRIIDYMTTTSQIDTNSAGNQFDVIVTADTVGTLNENARACLHEFNKDEAELRIYYRRIDQHENLMRYYFDYLTFLDTYEYEGQIVGRWKVNEIGFDSRVDSCYLLDAKLVDGEIDKPLSEIRILAKQNIDNENIEYSEGTLWGSHNIVLTKIERYNYFSNQNIESWEIKYCLDNDTNRFAWALTEQRRVIKAWESDENYYFYVRYPKGDVEGKFAWAYIGTFASGDNIEDFNEIDWINGLDTKDLGYTNTEEVVPGETVFEYDDYSSPVIDYRDMSGKGVIYYMKDDKNNECFYDFKNIKFRRYACIVEDFWEDSVFSLYPYWRTLTYTPHNMSTRGEYKWCYTFYDTVMNRDASMMVREEAHSGDYADVCPSNNVIKELRIVQDIDEGLVSYPLSLNNIVFYYSINDEEVQVSSIKNNFFDVGCHTITISKRSYDNKIGNNCYEMTMGNDFRDNVLSNICSGNTFGNGCGSNVIGKDFSGNIIECNLYSNAIKEECRENTFYDYCTNNIIGGSCTSNIFGHTFSYNILEYNCDSNSFGDSCSKNHLGNSCINNSFGEGCGNITFGNNCEYNRLQHVGTTFNNIILENNVSYVNLYGEGLSTDPLQNIRICSGVSGALNSPLNITEQRGLDHTVTYKANGSEEKIIGGNE